MEKSRKKFVLIGGIVIVGLLAVLGGLLLVRQKQDGVKKQEITEVKLEREDASITLTREGTLTVKISEGTFQQQWDESRVNAFFSQFENQDLGKYREPEAGAEGYLLTIITADGQQATYFIPFSAGEIPSGVEELIETLEQIAEGNLQPTPLPTGNTPVATPTPLSYYPTPVPTQDSGGTGLAPTPVPTSAAGGSGDEEEAYKIPFECDFSDPNLKQNVLSETVCTPN